MRIVSLQLPDFKNLRDFEISFDREPPTAVLVGRNATGKSNLIEAIVRIFRDLELDLPGTISTGFAYQLSYEIRKKLVEIDHDPSRLRDKTLVTIDEIKVPRKDLLGEEAERLLPGTVFSYYSGPSNRLESLFDRALSDFRMAMVEGDKDVRARLIYGRLIHSKFVLLAFFADKNTEILDFLRDELAIEALESVLFVIKQPYWASKAQGPEKKSKFWGARGIVREFLEYLYQSALAPLQLSQRVPIGIRRQQTLEHLYLYLKDALALREFTEGLPNSDRESIAQSLFKTLESAYVSDLIADVRVSVKKRNIDDTITFRELSEGEQQLLMVLGLLRFTNDEESLFLLDEPDTHLNPGWSHDYLRLINRAVGETSSSHVLIATHDPVAISSLHKEQVRQFSVDDETGRIIAQEPSENPIDIGVAGVLLSELFGFRSMLAPEVTELMEERQQLLAKEVGRDEERLADLNKKLSEVDLSSVHPDPLFAQFVRAMTALDKAELADQPRLSPEEIREERELAKEVLKEIRGKDTRV